MSDIQNPGADMSGAGPVAYDPGKAPADPMTALRDRHEARLLAIPGVTFVGVGQRGLQIGVLDAGVAARLPRDLEGVPLTVTVTGPVEALPSRK